MPGTPANPIDVGSLRELLAAGEAQRAGAVYQDADPDPDAARALFGQLANDEAGALLGAISDDAKAREILLWLPPEQAAAIAAVLEPANAARLVGGLPSDERADLLATLDDEPRDAIQAALPPEARADAARLLTYAPGSAGGLMETEYLAYPADATVREAIRDLRANQQKYAAIGVQYIYLLDGARRLVGVAPVRNLLLAPEDVALRTLAPRSPASIRDIADTHELAVAFDEHPFIALPVVDEGGVLLGVVNRADATEREHEEAEDDYRVSQGIVGGEELRSMPIATRFRRRTAWLGVNLALCLGGAAVIAWHAETLAGAIVVTAVLPVVSATSGNAAMQAAAVSIRELTLGIIEPDAWRRVLVHELRLASLIALPMGAAVAGLAALWGADASVGLAVGAAMALNALVAIAIGALCPLALRRVHIDPALAAGPISTTLADVSGFALTLGLVAWAVR
jgi:magnesium transporter